MLNDAGLWSQLKDKVQAEIDKYQGVVGFCLEDLSSGDTIVLNGGEQFPIASTIKIPILLTLLHREAKGEIDLQERVAVTGDMLVPGSGVLTYLEGPLELSMLDIAQLMIMVSDNTATNLCIDWATMEATNQLMSSLGLEKTRIRRKMQDHESVARNEENMSTPSEGVKLMRALYAEQPEPKVAQRCLSILRKPNRGPIERAMLPGVEVSNKPGGMERVRCDLGIVWLARHPYALAIMAKYAIGQPFNLENGIVDIVRLVHGYMEALDLSSRWGQGIPAAVLNA